MPIPKTTPLHFAILNALVPGEMAGRELREVLRKKHGHRRSGPAFYQLMSRLEEVGLVSSMYHTVRVGDQDVREKRYTISGGGIDAINEAQAFYAPQEVSKYAPGEA